MQKISALCLSLLVAATTLCAAAQNKAPLKTKVLCGVVKSDDWTTSNTQEGIYEFCLEDASLTKLTEGKDVLQAPLGGAVYEDGKMKGVHFRTVWDAYDQTNSYILYHVEYDMATWQNTLTHPLGDMERNYISSCGLAKNPVTGVNYGIFYNFNMSWQVVNRKLATIDFSTNVPTRQLLGTVTTPMAAIAFSDNGLLYGVGQDGYLYIISTEQAESEVEVLPLGDLGIDNISTNPSSMTFNKRTGKFLWSVVLTTGKSYLYEIDPTITSVSATQLMQLPGNAYLVNMYIPDPEAAEDAPAAVTDLTATFEGASTTGIVAFTAPTLTYSGDALTGTLTYVVKANGEQVATGEVEAGARAEAEVTVEAGDNEIVVTVANAAGTSPEAKIKVYAGPDTPTAPVDLTFDYDYDGLNTLLFWDAPGMGLNGTELNPADLTYNIYLMPEGTLVAEGISETEYQYPFAPATLASYYYKVEAVNGGMTGEAAESNHAVVGPALNPPYTQNFSNAASFDLFTVLDRNGDGITWKWGKNWSGGGRAECDGSNTEASDDWLVTPPFNLKKGATYKLSFVANEYVGTNVDVVDVAYGTGLRPEGYAKIFNQLVINSPVEETYSNSEIVPDRNGIYYFGFHTTTPAGYGYLLLKNITITMVKDAPAYARGDVNADGIVDVSDVNIAIDIVLGKDSNDKYDGRADLDGNGMVDVADVNQIIDIVLGK